VKDITVHSAVSPPEEEVPTSAAELTATLVPYGNSSPLEMPTSAAELTATLVPFGDASRDTGQQHPARWSWPLTRRQERSHRV
jgi:hypothetical protein